MKSTISMVGFAEGSDFVAMVGNFVSDGRHSLNADGRRSRAGA